MRAISVAMTCFASDRTFSGADRRIRVRVRPMDGMGTDGDAWADTTMGPAVFAAGPIVLMPYWTI